VIALRAAVAMAGIAFAVIVAEIGIRVSGLRVGRHTDTMFTVMEYDPRFGWLMKPGVEQRVDFVDVEGLAVRSNSLGFRDAEFPAPGGDASCRIAFLGDSFTWALGVTEDERFTTLVKRGHPAWETLNFGIPGFGTDQSLLVWDSIAARYEPNVVIFTMYLNDFVDNAYDIRYGRSKPYFEASGDSLLLRNSPVPRATFWRTGVWNRVAPPYRALFEVPLQTRSRIVHFVGRNSVLARAIYTAVDRSGVPATNTPADTTGLNRALDSMEGGRVELATAILRRMAARVASNNAAFVVYLAGTAHPVFEAQRARLVALGIPVEDATDRVLRPELGGRDVFFPFNGHWTAPANAVVAARMERWIASHGCRSGVRDR